MVNKKTNNYNIFVKNTKNLDDPERCYDNHDKVNPMKPDVNPCNKRRLWIM